MFHSNFHFHILDLFISNSFSVLYKLELTACHCVSSDVVYISVLQCCLGFMVVLPSLGAVNEFMCKQWERKGMKTDVYFSG